MERHEAHHIFTVTRESVIRSLKEITQHGVGWLSMVLQLDHAALELDDSVKRFNVGDAIEEHEDIYLPLFDALSYVKQARQLCGSFGVRTHLVTAIKGQCEHALEELEGAVSAELPY